MFRYDDDDERPQPSATGGYKIPDRDFYRKNFSSFTSVVNHLENKLFIRNNKHKRFFQPHFNQLVNITTPYSNILSFSNTSLNPADGICTQFLRRGFTKPIKIQLSAAIWSSDNRWCVFSTHTGDLALWEAESLKVHKIISIPAHKEFFQQGDGQESNRLSIKEQLPITAMVKKKYGNHIVTADSKGCINYCDETFKSKFYNYYIIFIIYLFHFCLLLDVKVIREAHTQAIRGLAYSPSDLKLASCSDDTKIHIWSGTRDTPELVFTGHQSDIKCIDWHPYRSLIATGSRDTSVKLWDPNSGTCVR